VEDFPASPTARRGWDEETVVKRILLMGSIPRKVDCGLLTLRLIAAIPLFLKHGTEKLFRFHSMMGHFPNPLHIGVVPSLLFATLSDGICTLLIIIGLATRWAALVCFINIFVALVFVHHFAIFGPQGDHGELMLLYLAAMAMLILGGAGKYSVDGWMEKSS
jgi:putative oxidoreductase